MVFACIWFISCAACVRMYNGFGRAIWFMLLWLSSKSHLFLSLDMHRPSKVFGAHVYHTSNGLEQGAFQLLLECNCELHCEDTKTVNCYEETCNSHLQRGKNGKVKKRPCAQKVYRRIRNVVTFLRGAYNISRATEFQLNFVRCSLHTKTHKHKTNSPPFRVPRFEAHTASACAMRQWLVCGARSDHFFPAGSMLLFVHVPQLNYC